MSDLSLAPDDLSLAKVAVALEETTERLAYETFSPAADAPAWREFEWRVGTAVAAMQGVSSLLCAGLQWSGPPGWTAFLERQRSHVAGRQVRIRQLLNAIDLHGRRAGVALTALKGAALLRRGIYRDDERPMADIDLLVRHANLQDAARVLEHCGFELTYTTWRHQVFEARDRRSVDTAGLGEHADHPIKIELHTGVLERLPVRKVDITHAVLSDAPRPGLNDYPSTASLMLHLLLHAAGNMRAHALRLIQLHDIARLSSRMRSQEWEELVAPHQNERTLWWAFAPLMLTARYCPGAIPPFVLTRVSAQCPWLLRRLSRRQRLTDVSWSNLRIYALPGIQWCRTPAEALRFVIYRVWPSRQTRSELKRFAAHQSGVGAVPWYGLSQMTRILRFALARPPRVQTLLPVRAALAQRHDGLEAVPVQGRLNRSE